MRAGLYYFFADKSKIFPFCPGVGVILLGIDLGAV